MDAKERMISNKYRSSILAVNEYDSTHFEGVMYNEFWNGTREIHSMQEFIKTLDALFSELGCPMESYQKRSFQSYDNASVGETVGARNIPSGKLGSFAIEIQYRNNATWQGTVTWLERNNREYFRSALELFFLIDSVASKSTR